MIIVKVMGGLGNQLFQYALYRQLQEKGREVYLDISWYSQNKDSNRQYQLDLFHTKIIECSEKQKYLLANNDKNIMGVVYHKIFGNKKNHIFESQLDSMELDILKLKTGYLDGYWQKKEYFSGVSDKLKKELVLKKDMPSSSKKILDMIENTNSIAIHVRRGDYLKAQNIYGGICTEKYYSDSVKYIEKNIECSHFFVFSDDMVWCRQFFEKKDNVTFVDVNSSNEGYFDLVLMSKCKNMIMANSSFSWWAAWLNDSAEKIVISPKRWNSTTTNSDLLFEDWIEIEE